MDGRVQLVSLKVKKSPTNAYDQLYGGPPIIVIDVMSSDEVSHRENAEKIYRGFLVHLNWETRRALGKYLISIHPADPEED